MNFRVVDTFSVAVAVTLFTLSAMFTSFVAATLFYAVIKERKLRVSAAIPVLNLGASGLLLCVVSGLFELLYDVLQPNLQEGYSSSDLLLKSFRSAFTFKLFSSSARYDMVAPCAEINFAVLRRNKPSYS